MKKILFLLLLLASRVFAWWDVPHMVISQIAKEELSQEKIANIEAVLAYFANDFPESSAFLTASCFPDDITSLGLSGFKVWHGVLTPYSPDHFLTNREIDQIESLTASNNLHMALKQAIKTLSNPNAKQWERSFMLRFLFHCVGDIHQPLHCIQLYNQTFPNGDLAGHRFKIDHPRYKNLHQLWDSGCDFSSSRPTRPLSEKDQKWMEAQAQRLTAFYPKSSFPELTESDYTKWSDESYQLAIMAVYSDIAPNQAPPDAYLVRGQAIAERQMALAGYRLALLLSELF